MEQMPTTIDSLIELENPSDPQISPDGQWVAYIVSKPDWKEDAFVSQIFLIKNEENAEPRQLTFSKNGSSTPCWTPDGQYLTFLSKRNDDEGTQIYRLSIKGGEAERLTELKTSIQNIKHAPDGKSIAFWAVPPETAQEKKRKEKFGDYIEDNVDYKSSQLWLLNLDNKKIRQLTTGDDFHVHNCQWRPNSEQIAITAMPSPDMNVLLEIRIYLLDVASMAIRPLTTLRTNSPHWSPDGQSLVYQHGVYEELEGAFYKNTYLEIMSLEDESTERLDMTFDEDPNPIAWSKDGIYFWAIQRTSIHLFCVSVESNEIQQVTPDFEGLMALEYSFDYDYSRCATILADADTFWEVAVMDVPDGLPQRLTAYNKQTEEWELPKHEVFTWKSGDGTEIEGVLTKPIDFDPNKKYPLLVVIHAGPTWISTRTRIGVYERRIYPIYQWVNQGAIVLQPNYRGSAGYGEEFRSLNVRDLGTGDYADVISGVDALIEEGWVDSERVGSMGWSQGGYISAFITCYSDRFKAVSVGAGISNWMTYYVNTDIHPSTRSYLKSTPWDDPEIYAKTSPITYIKNAQTPTLIQHGEKDSRVPVPNAFELHQGLLDQGVESKLVIYPGMPHGPTKPKQVRHIMNDNYAWFNRHIFGIEAEPAETPPFYIVVPPSDEEKSLVGDVFDLARRDGAIARVFATDGKLIEDQTSELDELPINQIGTIVEEITRQLIDDNIKKIILFSDKAEEQPKALMVLGCIQIAAGSIGKITLEHREGCV